MTKKEFILYPCGWDSFIYSKDKRAWLARKTINGVPQSMWLTRSYIRNVKVGRGLIKSVQHLKEILADNEWHDFTIVKGAFRTSYSLKLNSDSNTISQIYMADGSTALISLKEINEWRIGRAIQEEYLYLDKLFYQK